MDWLSVLSGIIKIVSTLTTWLGNQQLINAGKAEAISTNLQGALNAIAQADSIRASVDSEPIDKLHNDSGVIYRD